ncbi:hypothetical protein UFOVP235_10 [uncultured Caudovirales phage]|uniref:Uncharacterized protein n=1 Tax=uncultured Caudovirales phage TaxID=2100421 RepID=A0A6J7WQM7_9CAUD|nr:hypothetical protein UFOVP235_10 [uncultured Caudovirales phage]
MFKPTFEVAPPEVILANCKKYGVDPSKLHELDKMWLKFVAYRYAPIKNKRPWREHEIWKLNVGPHLNRYPYPPGVEYKSPEFVRILHARYAARRRSAATGEPLFIEGYHNIDTYKPLKCTKRRP